MHVSRYFKLVVRRHLSSVWHCGPSLSFNSGWSSPFLSMRSPCNSWSDRSSCTGLWLVIRRPSRCSQVGRKSQGSTFLRQMATTIRPLSSFRLLQILPSVPCPRSVDRPFILIRTGIGVHTDHGLVRVGPDSTLQPCVRNDTFLLLFSRAAMLCRSDHGSGSIPSFLKPSGCPKKKTGDLSRSG